MAQITKVSGTTQPVFAIDVQNGSIANTANIAAQGPVQVAGPKLEFFSLVANSALSASGAANATGFINNTLQAIQQTSTVAIYQVNPAAATILNIAIYPTGSANAAQILTAAREANATGGLNIGYASCAANAVFTTSPLS
jgi:hypothetical protein